MNTKYTLERQGTPECALVELNHKIQLMQAKNPDLSDDLVLRVQDLYDSLDRKKAQLDSLTTEVELIRNELEEYLTNKFKKVSSEYELNNLTREFEGKRAELDKKIVSIEKINRERKDILAMIEKCNTQDYQEFIKLLGKRENLEKILYPDKETTQSASYSAKKIAEDDSSAENRKSCKLNLLPYIADMLNTAWSKELCSKYKLSIDATNTKEKIEFNFQNFTGSIEVTQNEVTLSKKIPIAERARAVDAMIEIFIQGILKDKNMIFHEAYSADLPFKDLLEFKLAFQLKYVHGLAYHVVNGKSLDQILNKTAENDKKESPKKAGKKSKPNISEDPPEQMNRIKPTSG